MTREALVSPVGSRIRRSGSHPSTPPPSSTSPRRRPARGGGRGGSGGAARGVRSRGGGGASRASGGRRALASADVAEVCASPPRPGGARRRLDGAPVGMFKGARSRSFRSREGGARGRSGGRDSGARRRSARASEVRRVVRGGGEGRRRVRRCERGGARRAPHGQVDGRDRSPLASNHMRRRGSRAASIDDFGNLRPSSAHQGTARVRTDDSRAPSSLTRRRARRSGACSLEPPRPLRRLLPPPRRPPRGRAAARAPRGDAATRRDDDGVVPGNVVALAPHRVRDRAPQNPGPAIAHRVGDTFSVKGATLVDRHFELPLDHFRSTASDDDEEGAFPADATIRVLAPSRRAVQVRRPADLPLSCSWAAPGSGRPDRRNPRDGSPARDGAGVVLLRRGTGGRARSRGSATRQGARIAAYHGGGKASTEPSTELGSDSDATAALVVSYVAHHRADAIVADAEAIRRTPGSSGGRR